MSDRPRVGVRLGRDNGARVRMWLLQLGADPVVTDAEVVVGVPDVPQHPDVTRAEVADFVDALKGVRRSRSERFDDHGSAQRWPRGSF